MKMQKIIGKITAVILCVIYFFALSGYIILMTSKSLISGDYYAAVLKDIDLKKIKVSDMGELLYGSSLNEDATLEEALVELFTKEGIEEKTAIAIIENEEIIDVVGNFVGDYINYSLGGEKPKISKSDVKTILKNPDVVSITGNLSESEINEIYDQLNNLIDNNMEIYGGTNYDNTKQLNEVTKPY